MTALSQVKLAIKAMLLQQIKHAQGSIAVIAHLSLLALLSWQFDVDSPEVCSSHV